MAVLLVSPGNRHVTLNWRKQLTDTQYDETLYKIYYKPAGGLWTAYAQLFIKDTLNNIYYSVSDLNNGTAYEFKVTVVNPAAQSEREIAISGATTPSSSSTSFQAPRNLSFSSGTLTWEAPTELRTWQEGIYSGSDTSYVIQYKRASSTNWSAFSSPYITINVVLWPVTGITTRSYTFTVESTNSQLVPGEQYDFRVTTARTSGSNNYISNDKTRFDNGITTIWSSELRATAVQSIPTNPNSSWKFISSLPSDPVLNIDSKNIDINILATPNEAKWGTPVDSAGYLKPTIEKQMFSDNKQVVLAAASTYYYYQGVRVGANAPLRGQVLYLSMNGGQTWRVLLNQTSLGEKTSYNLIKVNNDGSFAIVTGFVDYAGGYDNSFIFYNSNIEPLYSIGREWKYNTIRFLSASLTDNNIGLCLLGNNQRGSTDTSTSLYIRDTQGGSRKSPSYLAATSDFWSRDVLTHSDDGKIIAYVNGTNTIFLSTDSGANWRSKTYSFLIKGIASSRNGNYIYILSDNNSSFISKINTIDMSLDSSFNASNPTNSTINYSNSYIEMAKTDDSLYFIPDDSLRQRWELSVSNGGSVVSPNITPTPTRTKAPAVAITRTPTRTKAPAVAVTKTPTRTPVATKPSKTVSNIVATGGNECIYLTWNGSQDVNNLLGYKVYYSYTTTNFQFVPAMNGDTLLPFPVMSAIITNVPNDTGYQVQIRIDAVYSDGKTYSSTVNQYTDKTKSVAGSPSLSITNPSSSDSADLIWTVPVPEKIGRFVWTSESSLLLYNNNVLEFQSDYQTNFYSYTINNKVGNYSFEISTKYQHESNPSATPIYVKSNRVSKNLIRIGTATPTPTNTVTPTVTPTKTPIIVPEFLTISLQENNFNKSNNYFNLNISSISSNYPILQSDNYDIEINGPYPFDDILHVAAIQSDEVTEEIITNPWRKIETRTADVLSQKIFITPETLGIYYVRINRLISNTYSNIKPFFRSFDIIEVPPTPTVTQTPTLTPTSSPANLVINPTPTRTPTKQIPGLTSIPTSTPTPTKTKAPFVPALINENDYTTAQIGVRDSSVPGAGYSLDCNISFNRPISYGGQNWEKLFLNFNGNYIKTLYDNENLPKIQRVYTTTEGFFQTWTSNILGLHQLKNITLVIESKGNDKYLWTVTAQYDKNTVDALKPMYASGSVFTFKILLDYSKARKTNATFVGSRSNTAYPYSVWEYANNPSEFLIDFDVSVNAVIIAPTPTITSTVTTTPTSTATNTPTPTSTPAETPTPTPTNIDQSVTRTPTATSTATPTNTVTPTITPSTSSPSNQYDVYSVGDNVYGQLANPFVSSASVFSPTLGEINSSIDISCGNYHTCFITNNGYVYSVGRNAQGQLGRTTANVNDPLINRVVLPESSYPFKQISCGASHTFALNSKGELYSWGNNTNGQLSLGDNIDRTTPTLVSGMINGAPSNPGVWKYVACGSFHTLAINVSGELYACGLNTDGQLGLGDNRDRLKLRKVTVDGNWTKVVAGAYHTLAINSNGQLYACGNNSKGQLGAGTVGLNTNVLGLSNSNIIDVSAGFYHSVCFKNTFPTQVYGCGDNSFNQVTNTSNSYQPSPSVGGWALMTYYGIEVSCGYNHTLILKNNNLLYGCGDNSKGQLGIKNNTSNNNGLIQIGDNRVVRRLANKQGSTHSIILIDKNSILDLPPTPTPTSTPTVTPTKRPPGSTATATPTNSATPTPTPTTSRPESGIISKSSKSPAFDIDIRYESYNIKTLSQGSVIGSEELTRSGGLFQINSPGSLYDGRIVEYDNINNKYYLTSAFDGEYSRDEIKTGVIIVYDQNWNRIKYSRFNARSVLKSSSIIISSYSTKYEDVFASPFFYSPITNTKFTLNQINKKEIRELYLVNTPIKIINNDYNTYKVVLYTYSISGTYDFTTLLNLLNENTANNGYSSPDIKFNSLGWYEIKSPNNKSPYNSDFIANISSIISQDYIYAIAQKTNGYDQYVSIWGNTINGFEQITSVVNPESLAGGITNPNSYRFKTNNTGSYTIKSYIKDNNDEIINGPDKIVTITSIAPNPIVSPTSTKTPTPTKTPSQTPTSAAKTIIVPISNYVPGSTTIYTPYKTSGAVCIFNEPDGSDYIRNQINDPQAYTGASTSKIMGNCLVPIVPNSPYPTIIAGIAADIVPNFTIEYYFYLNSDKYTTIYSSDASYYDTVNKTDKRTSWDLRYNPLSSSLSGLIANQNNQTIALNVQLQTGWYHFAVTFDKGEFRYFINGKQIGSKSYIYFDSTKIRPRVVTYVDQLDALRITKESLYYVPFTTLPHM